MFEFDNLNYYLNKLRPMPWRLALGVSVGSFLLASIVSLALGWWLMSQTKLSTESFEREDQPLNFKGNLGLGRVAVDKIMERNIFNSEGQIGEQDGAATGSQMAKTQIPIKVLGIIYGGTPYTGIAMVENTQGKTINSFMVGDQLTPDVKVVEIQREMIILDNQGRKEYAALEEVELRRSTRSGGVKKKTNAPETLGGSGYATDAPPENFREDGFERKGSNIELTAEYKNRLLGADFASVLQDAKASPNMVNGVLKGWVLDRIRKNSFWEKSGMQNGDIVEEINGVMLSDAGQSIKLLNGLRNESEIDIKVSRNGQKLNFNLKVR